MEINLNQVELEKVQNHLLEKKIKELRNKYPKINLSLKEIENTHGELKYTEIHESCGIVEIVYKCPDSIVALSGRVIYKIDNFDKYPLENMAYPPLI